MFHPGEEAVQRRAGGFDTAAKLGARMVQPSLAPDFAEFLAAQPVVYLAVSGPEGQVWVSGMLGAPGFAAATSPTRVHIQAQLAADDPVSGAFVSGSADVGLLVIEPMTRSRIRLNGRAHRVADGLELELREVFGNCPKHIQRRRPVAAAADGAPPAAVVGGRLAADQRELIRAADTFFVGSRHPQRGADASHRGGRPGFVAVRADGSGLTFPDYAGNMMFQTLGNLTVDPAIGLLFVDWRSGRTLQLTGRAEVVWDLDRIAQWPRAQRLVDVAIDQVVERPTGLPVVWELVEASRLNPEVPPAA